MVRPTRYDIPGDVRFLTWSCYQRLPLLRNPRIRDLCIDSFDNSRRSLGYELFAWVIMPDHIHALMRPQLPTTVADILRTIKQPVARQVLAYWRTVDAPILPKLLSNSGTHHFWQRGGGYDRNIRSTDDLREKLDYIHHNPVRRKLASASEEWHWSSAAHYAGNTDVPLTPDPLPL